MNAILKPYRSGFAETLQRHGLHLTRRRLSTLQVNVGKRCNQACHHCHVDAGPKRSEMMNAATADRVLALLSASPGVETVDITGGAPELNPNFRRLVVGSRQLGKQVIDRCNLTVLLEPNQADTAEFLANHGITVVASLPCYSKANVERQRGLGVFDNSIVALQRLNALGYGRDGSGLELHLVYNPVGPQLPPPQAELEAAYKRELAEHFGIVFNGLYTITNMPISRFLHQLLREGEYHDYVERLANAFNPAAAEGVMCRDLVSVGWDGRLYDCDFNQMLELDLAGRPRTIWDIQDLTEIEHQPIAIADHCYGCTAGAGSSCTGSLA